MDQTPVANPSWLRQNGVQLLLIAAVAALICRYFHPLDVLLAGFGLSFIIFLHELGHFAAAKLCGVHVKTFSIGFGPALPFCSFTYGETTYKVSVVPLGGFVSMVGEGDDSNDVAVDDPSSDEAHPAGKPDSDPRSLKNKPVWQRMIIISAGVIMNLLLAAALFVATYLHGVEEKPGVIARVEPGSAAWVAGVHPGAVIRRINDRANPWFDDIRPIVSSSGPGKPVSLALEYKGDVRDYEIEPVRREGGLFPTLGVLPPEGLTLRDLRRDPLPPVEPGSAAANAVGSDGKGFLPGDRVVAMTDPVSGELTPIRPDFDGLPGEFFDYDARLRRLVDKPVEFRVVRKGGSEPVTIPVGVEPTYDLGLAVRVGPVSAVRVGSPAERAGVRAAAPGQIGDQIVSVSLPQSSGNPKLISADPDDLKAGATFLDPLELPGELARWAASRPDTAKSLKITVLRNSDHTREPVVLELDWDASYGNTPDLEGMADTPLTLDGLGIAYPALGVVSRVKPGSPAQAAGLQDDDKVTEVRFHSLDADGKPLVTKWQPVKPEHWAFVAQSVQLRAPHALDLKVERDGQPVEVSLTAAADPSRGKVDRGLQLAPATRLQRAAGVGEALEMGLYRTSRKITETYQSLYAIVSGRISPLALQGPITMARGAYLIAGQDVWHLLIYLALVSVNLAVVNFLPIPVLDGGHMMFLGYEGVTGRPAPLSVQAVLTYLGLAMVLCLMLFTVGLDFWRLWKQFTG